MITIGNTRVALRALLVAAGAVILSVVILVPASTWYANRRAELDSKAYAAHAEWSRVEELTARAADWQADLDDRKAELGRYFLVVEDVATAPTDSGFRLIDRAEFEPLMLKNLQKLAEDTKCVLATYAPEPASPAPEGGAAVGQSTGGSERLPAEIEAAADSEAATIRVTGRYESVQRFICGLSDFQIPTTGIEQFWLFPQFVAVTNITMRSLSPEPGARGPAGAQADPLIEATLSARVFIPKPVDLAPAAVGGEALVTEPGAGEPMMEAPGEQGGPDLGAQPQPGGPGGPMPGMPGGGPGGLGGVPPNMMGPGGAGPRMGPGGMGPGMGGAPGMPPGGGAGPGGGMPGMGPNGGAGGGGSGRFRGPGGGQPGGAPGVGPGASSERSPGAGAGGRRPRRPSGEPGANQPEGGGGSGRAAQPPWRSQG